MKKLTGVLILLIVFCTAGCIPGFNNDSPGTSERIPEKSADKTQEEPNIGSESNTGTGSGEKTTLVLYYSNNEGCLVPEQREVSKVTGIARKTVKELLKEPRSNGLESTIPQGTMLLDINIRENLCTVDFSKELLENHSGGSAGELATVYSIVNTLTQFSTVEKVQILVDGQQVESLAGHVDISRPLERNSNILDNR